MASILYLGDDRSSSTSAHRASALKRLGHQVSIFNPAKGVSGILGAHWLSPVHYRLGYRLLQSQVSRWTEQLVNTIPKPDLVWVNSGELLGAACLQVLKQLGCPVILYNEDDPTGGRDGHRFDSLLKAFPFYDLGAVRRKENLAEYIAREVNRVMFVWCSYDEIHHRPFSQISEIPVEYRSEVAFIGTWMRYENRDKFLLELIRQGIPVNIWGNRWNKSPYFAQLRAHWRGPALSGRNYVAAIQGAKICLGFLSKGNRDLHTRRSVEIPFAGGLLCAERTSEHQELYQEGVEAVFWSDAAECASICKQLLGNSKHREEIRLAGMQRVRILRVGNEDICRGILNAALNPTQSQLSSTPHPLHENGVMNT